MRLIRLVAPHTQLLVAFSFYLLVSISVTWPGVMHLSSALIGRMGGDNYEHAWYLWWLAEVLFDGAGTPATIPILNHPSGVYVPLNLTHTPILAIPAIFSRVSTPIIAYNSFILLAPLLTALAMYFLVLELTKRRATALLGGLLFAFTPYAFGHIQAGHLSQITMVGFPLFALNLIRLLRSPTWLQAATAALSAFLAASHPSHLPYFILPTAIIIIGSEKLNLDNLRTTTTLVGAAIITLTLLAPFYAPLLAQSDDITTLSSELGGQLSKSIDIASFVIPPPGNPWIPHALKPAALRVVSNADETHGYLGLVGFLLAVIGICSQRGLVSHWVLLTGGAALLSLGPVLKLAGEPIMLTIDGSAHPLQLPYALLDQLPFFNWSRTPARFGATIHFGLTILAAYGLDALLIRLRRKHSRWILTGFLCTVGVTERIITFPFPTAPAWQTPSLQVLTNSRDKRAVLNVPVSFTTNNLALYGQTMHERPIVGGRIFRGSMHDQQNPEFLDALLRPTPNHDIISQPTRSQRLAILSNYGIGAIINQHSAENYQDSHRDALIATLGPPTTASTLDTLFLLPRRYTTLTGPTFALHPDDWQKPEQWGDVPARWFADHARIYLYSANPVSGHLQLTTIPGQQLHRIRLDINHQPLTTLIVGDWANYSTPETTLQAGLNQLSFTDLDAPEQVWGDLRCVGITALAGEFPLPLECDPHIKEQRTLSVALQSVTWHPSPNSVPLALFDNLIALDSVSWPPVVNPGKNLELTLNAHSLRSVKDDLMIFVHLVSSTGELLSQWDSAPLNGQFATSKWGAFQQLGFSLTVPIPDSGHPGTYQVELGWYDPLTGVRLPISTSSRPNHHNVLALGSFVID